MKTSNLKVDFNVKLYLKEKKAAVEEYLFKFLGTPAKYTPALYQSMQYSLSAGGKRIRPILSIASAGAVGGMEKDVIPVAVAVEMIHTYSLIHDDLPAMDNDDMRRGKPTNHRVFGEASAILAGDALLTHAFTILSDDALWDNPLPERVIRIIHETGLGAGPEGMVGGQQLDIGLEGESVDIKTIEQMHMKKTGALIRASIRAGGIAGGATDVQLMALTYYGEKIGLAFQIADDILDVEGSPEEVGKTTGKDVRQNKNTYPALIGLDESKAIAEKLVHEAIESLEQFDERAEPLRAIAEFVVERRS